VLLYNFYMKGGANVLKKVGLSLFVAVGLLFLSGFGVNASTGNWKSAWGWDLNGVSSVWTANADSQTKDVTLKVVRGSGALIGQKSGQIAENKTIEHTCWGQPLLDRQGQVFITGSHVPGFNS
jgi:hypothetical protein